MPPHGPHGFGGPGFGGPGFGGPRHHGCGGPGFGRRPLLGYPRYGICPGYGFGFGGGGLGVVGAVAGGALLASTLSSSRQNPDVVIIQQPVQQQPQVQYVQPQQQVQTQTVQQPYTQTVQQPTQQYFPQYTPPVTTPIQKYDMIDTSTLRLPSNAPPMEQANVHYTNESLPRSTPYPFQPNGQYSVKLTNLPDNVTWEELEHLFGGYHLVKVEIHDDGTGFVEFGDQQTYESALRVHGSTLRGRSIYIIPHQ
ncbi:hypothetical protein AKO1_002193 [Acrasis kona]|uniref:RRM domain-containing protein n=1 Tax=Acrasis kona TaxID=1008807 RepID=A0AAW2YNA2_9EUKA